MIAINCDIGERGAKHPVDVKLMSWIQIANLACGGHAGDVESVAAFRRYAARNGVTVSAHLSYPDRDNFGRLSMAMEPAALLAALDDQYGLLPDVKLVKFHGALYNDACVNRPLAGVLAEWLDENQIREVITPYDSVLASLCREKGMHILAEAFAERRYAWSEQTGQLTLVNRSREYASIRDCDEAIHHVEEIVNHGRVSAFVETETGEPVRKTVSIRAETICVHSDSEIALELARRLSEL